MGRTKAQECNWIIYYNESQPHGKYIKYIAVGAKEITKIKGSTIKGFYGTERECKAEADRMNREFMESFNDHKRHYVKQKGGK